MSFQQKLQKIVTFKANSNVNLQILHPDLKDNLIKQVTNTKRINWIFNNSNYTKWKMNQFITFIEETKIYKLELTKNYQKNIIKSLLPIKFSQLQFLNLEINWITNIEPIIYLNAPNLRWISLKANQIAEMRAFRKMTNPNLKTVKINLSQFLVNFPEINNYSRHMNVIARQLLRTHVDSVFSPRIKAIFNRKSYFFPIGEEEEQQAKQKQKQKKKSQTAKQKAKPESKSKSKKSETKSKSKPKAKPKKVSTKQVPKSKKGKKKEETSRDSSESS